MTDSDTLEIRGGELFWGGDGWPDEIIAIHDDRNESRSYRLERQGED